MALSFKDPFFKFDVRHYTFFLIAKMRLHFTFPVFLI